MKKKINITYVMLGAFVVLIAMLYAGIHSALKAENEWQQQMEDYEEDYKKAVEAVHAENYATAVDLLEKIPEDLMETASVEPLDSVPRCLANVKYVRAYAKYCENIASGEDIDSQYWVIYKLPSETAEYNGDFAEEMQEIKKVVQERYEAEKRRKEKEEEERYKEEIRKDQPFRGMEQRYISITKWGPYDRRTEENYRENGEVKKQVTYTWRNIGGSVYSAVCRDGEVVDLIRYVSSSSSSYRGKSRGYSFSGRSSSGKSVNSSRKDEYDVYDYDDPEDFYYDHEDEFDSFEDAEDYWDEAQ